MDTIKLLLSSKKNIIALIVLAVLAVGIVVGVRLVQQQTQLKSKAASTAEIKFTGDNVSSSCRTVGDNTCTATSREIQLEITNPFSSTPTTPPSAAIRITTIDPSGVKYSTYQSHNQKVVANNNGIFMTYLDQASCVDPPDGSPPCTETNTWILARSTDGGTTFTPVLTVPNAYSRAPVIETDSLGNIYLVEANWVNPAQARFYKFSPGPNNDYTNPPLQTTLSLGTISGKYAMEIDESRSQLYFFTLPGTFTILDLDGIVKSSIQLTKDGPHGGMHYPYLYLDENNNLYAAWTTSPEGSTYWSIHFIRSNNGGKEWVKPDGQSLPDLPIFADETGPAAMINLSNELDLKHNAQPWLHSMIVKGGIAHFMYDIRDPFRMHYVRYNLASGSIESNLYPVFKGENIDLRGLDGFCATNRLSGTTIYCINRNFGPYGLAVLESDDNGLTWHDYVLAPPAQKEIYALGGSPQISRIGNEDYIIGFFTEDATGEGIVKFFKVQAGQ